MLGLQPDYLLRLSRRTTVVFAFSPSTPQSNAFRRRSQLLIVTAHQAEPNFRNASICDGEVTLWVKLRRPQYEHMFSALPSNSDIAGCSRHVSNVPISASCTAAESPVRRSCADKLTTSRRFPVCPRRPTQARPADTSVARAND